MPYFGRGILLLSVVFSVGILFAQTQNAQKPRALASGWLGRALSAVSGGTPIQDVVQTSRVHPCNHSVVTSALPALMRCNVGQGGFGRDRWPTVSRFISSKPRGAFIVHMASGAHTRFGEPRGGSVANKPCGEGPPFSNLQFLPKFQRGKYLKVIAQFVRVVPQY